MSESATEPAFVRAPIPPSELSLLQQRSDARGLLRLFGHVAAIACTLSLHAFALERTSSLALQALTTVASGFTFVTMFAAMHESVHRTAFKSRWLNDAVAWFAGLLSFYNSTFYRPYHGWHHRFTQIPGKDPELEDPKPTGLPSYLVELSGVTWWLGKLRTHATLALGRTAVYPFLNEATSKAVVRSVRLQLLVYFIAIGVSAALGEAYFVWYWLLPVAAGQPLLRAILLAEHTGCTNDDNPLSNTRTTYTLFPVRFLMWEMPYHAEHHHYPAIPFFALAPAHARLGPELRFVARRGYSGMHADLVRTFARARAEGTR